ncbi:aminotransferase class V-fold PLP-dependent enzyme [Paenibacillus agricola]|uniref:Aminotransferase class V-fold PLP-dependent enzyme n=1 Tax=Paenibacillus agricola TaxID=2716264 RepID=A0ABX0JHQ8_9BACL|nr:aminotransferase class V-fold PLP-dependent enzyme [Paenibacillus agricola]NHN33386.1 aminotransferase class V-fold PLP-dependent enzyme [Paenibacillus agricola]
MSIQFTIASSQEEMQQIHQLNYRTFVEEIPQHSPHASRQLIDRFHQENTYLIGMKQGVLVAMLAIRHQRPFSLDEKLAQLDSYLPFIPKSMVEIRLLAVDKQHRSGQVFYGLAQYLKAYLWNHHIDLALISGTTRQLKLYGRLGFVPFAHIVGTAEASYQPMYMTRESFGGSETAKLFAHIEPVSFCAGPVKITEPIATLMKQQPLSHRSASFMDLMSNVQKSLAAMTQANYVQVLLGSGTLANDVVAGQISRWKGQGLILVNGEFGYRLVDHAERLNLPFTCLQEPYGSPFKLDAIEAELQAAPYAWLWMVHCETSTGMLNNTEGIKKLCKRYNIWLFLDCISSLGAVPIDLSGVYMASGVSGKAIGAYTGLAFVFHQEDVTPDHRLPRYLDLGLYVAKQSVPFSHSSNLLSALDLALQKYATNEPYEQLIEIHQLLTRELKRLDLRTLTDKEHAAPLIVTIPIYKPFSSQQIGDALAKKGFHLQYESEYLLEHNFLQIATIGIQRSEVLELVQSLETWVLDHK